MRAWILATLLLTSVLAGCAGTPTSGVADETVADSETTNPDGSAVEPGNKTQAPAVNFTNTAPEAMLNATIDGLAAIFNITVTDLDNDTVTWIFDATGNGAEDHNGTGSAIVNITYAAAGVYNATLTVTDGTNETIANMTVVIEAAVSYLPGQHAEGSFTAGGATLIGCFGDIFGIGYPASLEGVFYRSFAIEPHTIGYDYTASVSADLADSPGFAFLDAGRSVLTSGFMSTHATGEVPAGAAYGVWWACLATPSDGVFDSFPPA